MNDIMYLIDQRITATMRYNSRYYKLKLQFVNNADSNFHVPAGNLISARVLPLFNNKSSIRYLLSSHLFGVTITQQRDFNLKFGPC